ncbi:hypothetical protein [Yersinia enterocolitica]|uniref:hypothetical protein n=1 Tax=Yersinia enterocolitica TaxID=630 RepID=UPI002A0CA6F3|nr:hypothetical protein [Yersinia enterocolitica]EKN6091046.1 hypothetical protein [Yersinia enterocolitica]ELY5242009.1 hypothetical protein [Yersinia enterocolitica]
MSMVTGYIVITFLASMLILISIYSALWPEKERECTEDKINKMLKRIDEYSFSRWLLNSKVGFIIDPRRKIKPLYKRILNVFSIIVMCVSISMSTYYYFSIKDFLEVKDTSDINVSVLRSLSVKCTKASDALTNVPSYEYYNKLFECQINDINEIVLRLTLAQLVFEKTSCGLQSKKTQVSCNAEIDKRLEQLEGEGRNLRLRLKNDAN